MAYKISDTAIITTDSDGKSILVAKSAQYDNNLSIGSTVSTLPSEYFTNYFPTPDINRGTSFGYAHGGQSSSTSRNTIDKFPFVNNSAATDVGDLTVARGGDGSTSTTHGYKTGSPPTGHIDKWPFAADANATDVGDVSFIASQAGSQSPTHGYGFGGYNTPVSSNVISKYSHVSDGDATDVGDLVTGGYGFGGASSPTHGYRLGGAEPGDHKTIEKFPYASDANATDVGNLPNTTERSGAQQSDTHAYSTHGRSNARISKVAFANDAASDVGLANIDRNYHGGLSSTTHGYAIGGTYSGTVDVMKYPFASDDAGSDAGNDLTQARKPGGQVQA